MRQRGFAALIIGLLAVVAAAAQEAADKELQQLRGTLTKLEKQVWEAIKKQDQAALKTLWAKGYAEIGGGQRRDREQSLQDRAKLKLADYTLGSFAVVRVHADTAILSYTFRVVGTFGESEVLATNTSFASSVYTRRDGKWLLAFHQTSYAREKK